MKRNKWMKRRYVSVRTEIIIIFLIYSIITVSVFLTIYNHNLNELRRTDLNHLSENNRQLASITNSIITDVAPLFQMHYEDTKLRNILSNPRMAYDEKNRFENTIYVENTISHGISGSEYVVRCCIFTNVGDIYSNVSSIFGEYKEFVLNLIMEGKGLDSIYYTEAQKWSIGLVDRNVITAIRALYNYNGTTPLAWVVLDISYEKLEELLKMSDAHTGTFLLCNDVILYNEAITGISEEDIFFLQNQAISMVENGKEQKSVRLGSEKYLVTALKSASTQWILGRYVAEREALRCALNRQTKDLTILFFTVLLVFFVYYYRIRSMVEPLRKLNRVVRSNKRGALEKVTLTEREEQRNWNNEILTVVQNYNAMAERLNEYTEKILQYQISQKEAQIKMLTYQINPHFLYNTLNTISAMAEIENMEHIVKITESISNIFRYTLKEDEIVSLNEELAHVKDYIQIQMYRFPERFQVEYKIPEELKRVKIMKFILQPIVENSISHGLFEKTEKGNIVLEAYMEADRKHIQLIIQDNGIGISEKRLEILNQKLELCKLDKNMEHSIGADGIGIMNVNARISGYYGDNCGLTVYSLYGKGTKVVIRLKINQEEICNEDSNCRG